MRDRFSPDAPLICRHLHLDAQIIRYLLGNNGLDSRLAPFCHLIHPTLNELFLNPELQQKLSAIAQISSAPPLLANSPQERRNILEKLRII